MTADPAPPSTDVQDWGHALSESRVVGERATVCVNIGHHAMRDDGDPVARRCARDTVYMIDQCHNIEPKMPAMIRSVMNLQEVFAKALLVDREVLLAAQVAGDALEANRALADAFATDARPLLAELRTARGLPADPYRAYLESGHDAARAAARAGGSAAGWG